jgi:hypothetical protein
LHNPFSKATVPLTALDSIIDKTHEVRKVLMRSTEDDLIVAVMTDSRKCPFILSHGGNTAWFPESWEHEYIYIIDIAFLEGKLYAITQNEKLFSIDIDLDDEGKLVVANGYYGWRASDYESEEEEEGSDEHATVTIDEHDHDYNEEVEAEASYEDNYDNKKGEAITLENEHPTYDDDDEWREEEVCEENDDNLLYSFDYAYEDTPQRNKVLVATVCYLIESRGKLLMVRQHVQIPNPSIQVTCQVEVFEAVADAWVPMTNGLGGGQALFVSMRFSKSVPAPCGEIEDDTIYFANTGEIFNMRSETCSPTRWWIPIPFGTWFFPPDLVV